MIFAIVHTLIINLSPTVAQYLSFQGCQTSISALLFASIFLLYALHCVSQDALGIIHSSSEALFHKSHAMKKRVYNFMKLFWEVFLLPGKATHGKHHENHCSGDETISTHPELSKHTQVQVQWLLARKIKHIRSQMNCLDGLCTFGLLAAFKLSSCILFSLMVAILFPVDKSKNCDIV